MIHRKGATPQPVPNRAKNSLKNNISIKSNTYNIPLSANDKALSAATTK
jgi:hypothetical protein